MNLGLVLNSLGLGVGLAMDAFSVSLANGLNQPCMSNRKQLGIAGIFGFFQGLMPMIGWVCIHTLVSYFKALDKYVPWVALVLLLFIGGKMLIEGIKGGEADCESKSLGLGALLVQGIATSIDALSVGLEIAHYSVWQALISALIIGVTTFFICFAGIIIGKKAGTRLAGKASVLGGLILIAIGIEIFIKGVFF